MSRKTDKPADKTDKPADQKSLRLRALSHITGRDDPQDERVNASSALSVLYELASSPLTAASSLKLLHELQVHQVKLDLQEEELRRAVADLETALFRQVQIHEFAPAALFSVDRATVLGELNRAGVQLLGLEHDLLVGRALDSFLKPDSSRALHAALARVANSAKADGTVVHFIEHDGTSKTAYASVGPDPSGHGFLVVCVEVPVSPGDLPAP